MSLTPQDCHDVPKVLQQALRTWEVAGGVKPGGETARPPDELLVHALLLALPGLEETRCTVQASGSHTSPTRPMSSRSGSHSPTCIWSPTMSIRSRSATRPTHAKITKKTEIRLSRKNFFSLLFVLLAKPRSSIYVQERFFQCIMNFLLFEINSYVYFLSWSTIPLIGDRMNTDPNLKNLDIDS